MPRARAGASQDDAENELRQRRTSTEQWASAMQEFRDVCSSSCVMLALLTSCIRITIALRLASLVPTGPRQRSEQAKGLRYPPEALERVH